MALALSVLFATSHSMINLDEQGMAHSLLALSQDLVVGSGRHQGKYMYLCLVATLSHTLCGLQTDQD